MIVVKNAKIRHTAASNGHLHIIQWLHRHKLEIINATSYGAAQGGHLNILKWLREKLYPQKMNIIINRAALCGYLDIIQWAVNNGGGVSEHAYGNAIDGECTKVISWMKVNYSVFDKSHDSDYDDR